MNRRTVRYPDFDAVLADVDGLLAGGYDRGGRWTLGQMGHHLATVIEMSMDGFPSAFPAPFRLLARWLVLGRILRHQRFGAGYAAPKYMEPPENPDDRAGVDRLRQAVARFRAHPGPLAPSPLFGRLTAEQWREVHLWHCEHHFSFLHPMAAPSPPG